MDTRSIIGAEVLVVDKDPQVRDGVAQLVAELGMYSTCVGDPADCWEPLNRRAFSVAVVDLDTPSPDVGIETVRSIALVSPTTSILVLTPRKAYEPVVQLLRAGAKDVIYKSPESVAYLKTQIADATIRSQSKRQRRAVCGEVSQTHGEFLQLLMSAEREIVDLRDRMEQRSPEDLTALNILVITPNLEFAKELAELVPTGTHVQHAQTGGEALDLGSTSPYQFALLSNVTDLPQSMILRSLQQQNPELVALVFSGPGPEGTLEIAGGGPGAVVLAPFLQTAQLVARLPDLAEAFIAKEAQRRYTQAFREKHYDFVRRFVLLKEKIAEM